MRNIVRRLRWLVALAGLCAACGTEPEVATSVQSAVFPPNISAQKNAVWSYYTGVANGAGAPSMTMMQPDINCSPVYLGWNEFQYRNPSYMGLCMDVGGQVGQAPCNFWATYEIYQNRRPAVQQPWYATLAVNFLCIAAYRRAGFTDAQLQPYCSDGYPQATLPTVRRWIHDTYYAADPYWQQ